VPGWHANTKKFVEDGKLLVLGIAPEQHGDRMALFLQWKGMEDMTVMLDSYNLLGLKAVPITLLIDESGVVQHRNPKLNQLDEFLAAPPAEVGSAPRAPRPSSWVDHKDLFPPRQAGLSLAIGKLESIARTANQKVKGIFHFQRGVAYRKLFDLEGIETDPGEFAKAVAAWRKALELDPSNYIWRRRLQQYGPRLDKPYPFYDWVETARRELRERGVEPHPLRAALTGAEVAQPLRNPEGAVEFPHPDPKGKLFRDVVNTVHCSALVVPHTVDPGKAVRIFVALTPNPVRHAKWNDEAGTSTIRLYPPKGWHASRPVIAIPPPKREAERETGRRTVEFELRRQDPPPPEQHDGEIAFQVFYNVCHGEDRVCQFMRRDLTVPLALENPSPPEEIPPPK